MSRTSTDSSLLTSPTIPEPEDIYSITKSSIAASTKEPPEPASPVLKISSATTTG